MFSVGDRVKYVEPDGGFVPGDGTVIHVEEVISYLYTVKWDDNTPDDLYPPDVLEEAAA